MKYGRSELDQAEFDEAVDLLIQWYRRWQGSLPSVVPELPERTRNFIERHGESVPQLAWLK